MAPTKMAGHKEGPEWDVEGGTTPPPSPLSASSQLSFVGVLAKPGGGLLLLQLWP